MSHQQESGNDNERGDDDSVPIELNDGNNENGVAPFAMAPTKTTDEDTDDDTSDGGDGDINSGKQNAYKTTGQDDPQATLTTGTGKWSDHFLKEFPFQNLAENGSDTDSSFCQEQWEGRNREMKKDWHFQRNVYVYTKQADEGRKPLGMIVPSTKTGKPEYAELEDMLFERDWRRRHGDDTDDEEDM